MASIFDLTEDFREVLEQCDGSDNDISETLAALKVDIDKKAMGGIGIIKELNYEIESINNEIKNLVKRKNNIERNLRTTEQHYMSWLRFIGKRKYWTPRGTMSIATAGGKRKMVIDDENLVPTEFKITRYEEIIDKDTLRDRLENGEVIEGAHLEERGEYLKIS